LVTVIGSAPFSCSIESRLAPSPQITGGSSTTIYLGYGPQSTTLVAAVSGQGQFTYSWTPSTGLSCTNCLSPVFTPTAAGNYTFTLTVTSANGCESKCEITICVLDIRVSGNCGGGNGGNEHGNSAPKVYICHYPPGNIANMQTICIGVAGVPAHVPLHGGDRLGKCEQVCGSAKTDEELPELITDQNGVGFDMLIYPNPFTSQFQLKVESESTERIDIRIFNVAGQLITSQAGIEPNTEVFLGNNIANGFYFLEVSQAGFKKTIRVTKAK
jgi:PKD repeat protein